MTLKYSTVNQRIYLSINQIISINFDMILDRDKIKNTDLKKVE